MLEKWKLKLHASRKKVSALFTLGKYLGVVCIIASTIKLTEKYFSKQKTFITLIKATKAIYSTDFLKEDGQNVETFIALYLIWN